MGVKNKKNQNKNPEPEVSDEVTELEKQVFEIQLADINRKINRLVARQEELKQLTAELKEKAEEQRKENKLITAEKEQILAQKEEEKIQKREEAIRLSKEIKVHVEKHKKQMENLEKKYEDMVKENTKIVETLSEQSRILEDFKQNKDAYTAILAQYEKDLAESEVEHQRMLFNIERKGEIAKIRVKKELESRLLNLSIDFQQVYQKQIGDACHRMTLENKAIETELKLMNEELADCRERKTRAKNNIEFYKTQLCVKKLEKDKALARTILQKTIIQDLLKDRTTILNRMSEYTQYEIEHKNYLKKLRSVESEKQKQLSKIKELNRIIEEKEIETQILKEATKDLNKTFRKLQLLIRNGLKFVEEAGAVRLIPAGGMEEEKFLTNEAKVRLFKKRRETVFQKKGRILQHVLEFFASAQFTEEILKLLQMTATESINLEDIDFTLIYGKGPGVEQKLEHKESVAGSSLVFGYHLASDASLPRSVSELIRPIAEEVEEEESFEGEMEEDVELKDLEADRLTASVEVSEGAGEEGGEYSEESSPSEEN